jgi:hypothetical protein
MIKNYLALEGFEKESRINQPELELAIAEFLSGSHSPEVEAIKKRLRPHLLWDKQLQKQIQSLFKRLSVQVLHAEKLE